MMWKIKGGAPRALPSCIGGDGHCGRVGSVHTFLAAQPAAAAEDPWVAEIDNVVPDVYRFTVPSSTIQEATGITGSVVAVEGNFGPGKTWSQLNMGAGGATGPAPSARSSPVCTTTSTRHGRRGTEDTIAFRNPYSPQEVTSKPTWNTLFVDGPGAEWLADVPAGGSSRTLTYDSSVTGDGALLVGVDAAGL